MIKSFTKISLGLTALAASMSANATEWREIFKEDFGGNESSDPAICKDEPKSIESDFTFYAFDRNPEPGNYMIIKATQLAEIRGDINLTNWGAFIPSAPSWAKGGDHTNSDDPNIGYFMAFNCDRETEIIYKKSLPVTATGCRFKFDAWMANLDGINKVPNTVRLSISSNDSVLTYEEMNLMELYDEITWINLSTEFKISDPSITSLDFSVEAVKPSSVGWDFGLDDITISISAPEINIEASEFYFHEPADLTVTYDKAEIDEYFGGNGLVYQWYKLDETSAKYEAIIGADGTVSDESSIKYTIPAFDKVKDNGTYRVAIAPKDDLENEQIAIYKDFVINEAKNKATVEICQDSTKIVNGITLSASKTGSDEELRIFDDIDYLVRTIFYKTLEPQYIDQCLNDEYPEPGEYNLDPIITRDEYGCPKTIQDVVMNVRDAITRERLYICKGEVYNGKTYDEDGEFSIIFDEDGCKHQQDVIVIPSMLTINDYTICAGESLFGINYDEVGTFEYKTIVMSQWGCDSIAISNITVTEAPSVPLEEVLKDTVNNKEAEPLTSENLTQTLSDKYTLKWYTSNDATTEPNTDGKNSVVVDKSVETTYEFYIAYASEEGCYSDRSKVLLTISKPNTAVETISADDPDAIINVYTISGALVKENVKRSEALKGLANGTYLVGNEKVVINKR